MIDLVLGACRARSILDGTTPMRQYQKTGFHWTSLGIVIFSFGVIAGYKITIHVRDFTLFKKIPDWHGRGRFGGAGKNTICQKLSFFFLPPQCKLRPNTLHDESLVTVDAMLRRRISLSGRSLKSTYLDLRIWHALQVEVTRGISRAAITWPFSCLHRD